jgi:hypothetical protein
MHPRERHSRVRAAGLLIGAIAAIGMVALVMAYHFTGDFTGLFK